MAVPRPHPTRPFHLAALALVGTLALADVAAASNVVTGLADDAGDVTVPTWLYLLTGGAVVGASGLLSMLVTDRAFIEGVHEHTISVSTRWLRPVVVLPGAAGVVLLALVVVVGLVGPTFANANLAVLVVFVGARAGLTTVAYLIGNPWPAIDPWRAIAERLPNGFVDYPADLGVLPAVVGLLSLIWIEVIVPVTTVPRVLAVAVLAYSVYTLAGAIVFSPDDWFRYGDPLSVWFRFYGAVAPIQRTESGLELRLPGARLREGDAFRDLSVVAFSVLLVWELTYSGFVVTPPGVRTVELLVGIGLPPAIVYLSILLSGYALFLGIYWLAARRARRRAETYLTTRYLAFRFAPPLLAIAAGYHLAHYASFLLSLSPSLVGALATPFSPPLPPQVLVPPPWFGTLDVAFVLVGHVLAVWAAHAASFDLFAGRLQAIRSQFPFVLVMVLYTMLSLWLLSLPTQPPAFVA
ncbi:hypothetical protein [Natronorarus salvus]|uniref:hypothetical protein n=1 Tax=Natronorarus salvus TaxID=3117733 RepID=UPI002F2674BE